MGYLSHRVHPDQIKAGDHIYTWRPAFTYSHHGIYVGENMVVHFTAPETADSGSGWNLSSIVPSSCLNSIDSGISQPKGEQNRDSGSCLNSVDSGLSHPKSGQSCDSGKCLSTHYCGFKQPESGVMVSCLNCFIGTGSLYLYQYGVNACVYVSKLRGGTCTTKASDPPEDVISRAVYLLHNGFGDYNVVKNNCEDFALYCKTGLLVCGKPATGGSGQVNFVYNAPWKSIVTSAVPKLVTSAVPKLAFSSTGAVTVAVAVGTVCWNRYTTDIGVRDDVVKVKVEDVGSFRGFKKPVNHELDGHDENVTGKSCTR